MGDKTKELNRVQQIDPKQIPANMKMPEQLTEDELRKEVVALRNILKQSQAKIQELANGWGLKRLEMMFEMLKINKFSPEIEAIVKQGICEDLGIIGMKETDEIE